MKRLAVLFLVFGVLVCLASSASVDELKIQAGGRDRPFDWLDSITEPLRLDDAAPVLHLEFVVKDAAGDEVEPAQAMLSLTNQDGEQYAYWIEADDDLKFALALHIGEEMFTKIPENVGVLKAALFVGGEELDAPFRLDLGLLDVEVTPTEPIEEVDEDDFEDEDEFDIDEDLVEVDDDLEYEEDDDEDAPAAPHVHVRDGRIGEDKVVDHPQRDVRHEFREPAKRAPRYLSDIFSFAVVSPWIVLIILLAFLGAGVAFPGKLTAVYGIAFIGAVVGAGHTLVMYWVNLTIVQFGWRLLLWVPAAVVFGHRLFKSLERRDKALEDM